MINLNFNPIPLFKILLNFANRFFWWEFFFWPLQVAKFRSVHKENPSISWLIAWQGVSMSYSILITAFASPSVDPHLPKLLRIRSLFIWNLLVHLCFHLELWLINSDDRISDPIFVKFFRVEIAISSVTAAWVIPARTIVDNFMFACLKLACYFSYIKVLRFCAFRIAGWLIKLFGCIIAPPFEAIGSKILWRRLLQQSRPHSAP